MISLQGMFLMGTARIGVGMVVMVALTIRGENRAGDGAERLGKPVTVVSIRSRSYDGRCQERPSGDAASA
jgi:hypothetical protein